MYPQQMTQDTRWKNITVIRCKSFKYLCYTYDSRTKFTYYCVN